MRVLTTCAAAHITDVFDADLMLLLLFIVDCGSDGTARNSLLFASSPMVGVLFLTVVFQI